MNITENISLRPFNTFGIDVSAHYFSSFSTQEELAELLTITPAAPFILGGGSNILFTRDIDGLVLKNEISGVDLIHEDDEYLYVKAGAGENWHAFVLYCLERGWAGVENLSLIPGNVGAAPMQNIGAYGVEIKDVFHELEAYDMNEQKVYTFTLNDCEFGYRESVFKRKYRDRFVILNVTFRLRKQPAFHTSYGAIREELDKMRVQTLSINAISQAVINIRSSKLPDPKQIGNAGSFFKNPTVSNEKFASLRAVFPTIVGFPNSQEGGATGGDKGAGGGSVNTGGSSVKLAAGWLIEQCGWKGFRRGDAGCHARQALVLVNYGNATGREIYELSEDILVSVEKKFGVLLEREVNIL
jgi:UDP-N-acetylmuramate dehydrogenase